MAVLVNLNGVISPPEEAKVSVMDRGFLFGDGVYEAGRSYDRCFLYLEEHWERFRKSASKLRLDVPYEDSHLTDDLHRVAAAYAEKTGQQDMCFRTVITRGVISAVGLDLKSVGKPTLCHIVQDVPKKFLDLRKEGAKLLTSKVLRNPVEAQDPNIKTSNYLNSLLAQQEVHSRGEGEAVLCDSKGNVTEGTNFSLFAVNEQGKLLTPSLEIGILDSITRRHVIQLAQGDFEVEEGFFPLEQFRNSREIFMVSSTREVMPVQKWDEKTYSVSGEVTQRLHEKLTAEIQSYVDSHPKF